jgi:hypothetical protein
MLDHFARLKLAVESNSVGWSGFSSKAAISAIFACGFLPFISIQIQIVRRGTSHVILNVSATKRILAVLFYVVVKPTAPFWAAADTTFGRSAENLV